MFERGLYGCLSAIVAISCLSSGCTSMETKENVAAIKSPKENLASQHQLSGPRLQYLKSIKEKLDQQWTQAKSATEKYPSGDVVVRVILPATGTPETIIIIKSSGLAALDEEALSVVQAAAPFAPFPTDLGEESITLDLKFVYETGQTK